MFSPSPVFAADQNFVTPVFPIRGREYWREGGDYKNFSNTKNIVLESGLPATWLLHYDVLEDKEIIARLKEFPSNQEIGLFLEVTRNLSEDSFVVFDWEHDHWSSAHKLFLSGYSLSDRRKIIDNAFESFKKTFNYYPKSYGSWYTDVYSMEYIKNKYGAEINLGLADQYSTDGYQTWGQYINQPYFVSKFSAIEPALEQDNTGILKVLWAPREPTLSFGDNVDYSNFSLQLNDYFRTKKLPHEYFSQLLKDLTLNVQGPISQAVLGIEVAEVGQQHLLELNNQLKDLQELKSENFVVTTLSEFNHSYRKAVQKETPALLATSSPSQDSSSYWYMSPHYRLGLFVENNQVILKDLRFYHQNLWRDNDQTQIDNRHNLSRVVPAKIDQVVYGNQLVLGEATGLRVQKENNSFKISFSDKSITLNSTQPEFEGSESFLKDIDTKAPESYSPCFESTGGYRPPNSCLKNIISTMSAFIPDIRYSNILNQRYLGVATGEEALLGIRFPALKIGTFEFEFPVLENFISLKKKLTPSFSWFGRQEYEVSAYDQSLLIDKQAAYGQDNLRKYPASSKLFENGYYLILKNKEN